MTGKTTLRVLGVSMMLGAVVYFTNIQLDLQPDLFVAIIWGIILGGGPPALGSFLVAWSPGAMLVQRTYVKTFGFVALLAAFIFLSYYSLELSYAWWAAQEGARETGLVRHQTIISYIAGVLIPSLVFSPFSYTELRERIRQAHLVKKYEIQSQGEIEIMRRGNYRALELANKGSNRTPKENQELASYAKNLIEGIDSTLDETRRDVHKTTRVDIMQNTPYLLDNPDIQRSLNKARQLLGDEVEEGAYTEDDEGESSDQSLIQQRLAAYNKKNSKRK
jgi:hypothetical protein